MIFVLLVVDKRKQEPTGPEAKRSRNHFLFSSFSRPGKEFVNPTSGFFCSLCSVFYLNEDTAKEIHCSSQEHYDNLKVRTNRLKVYNTKPLLNPGLSLSSIPLSQNYYQRLQQNVQGSLSDGSA
uniref:Matrin-type domain-containing protein n=1 Tax=Xiphophorus couchianus TaxID=32473 RepID=A0A3B5LII4_9TELE